MNRTTRIGVAFRMIVLVLGLITAGFWTATVTLNSQYFFGAAGLTALLITLIPIVCSKTYDWFCPWSTLILGVLYGCAMPAICMTFDLPDREFLMQNILLYETPDFFVWPSMLILLSLGMMAVGYFGYPARQRRIEIRRVPGPNRVMIVCTLCALTALAAFLIFFYLNGGLSGGLSQKRGTISTIDVGEDDDFSQRGWLRQFAKLANVALLMLLAWWARNPLPKGSIFRISRLAIFLVLLLVSIAFPFYSSSRAGIMWVAIGMAGVTYYSGGRLLSPRLVGLGLTLGGIVIAVTLMRNNGMEDQVSINDRIGRMMSTRQGPNIATTAHIVHAIPDRLDYQYGKTIAIWLLAPIPRELMPNKPLLYMGPVIGQEIYDQKVSGVPPGMPAELYWNFHIPGVIFGSLLLGALLRIAYQFFCNLTMDPVLTVPIYVYAVLPIAFKAVTNSVGPGIVMSMVELVTATMVVLASSVYRARRNSIETTGIAGTGELRSTELLSPH